MKDFSNSMVSFIIPNWNHKEMLSECIASIYATNDSISKDVIVVDNASTDGSGEYMKKMYPDIQWIQNETNLGYAKAVNHGVKLSKGNFIFLLNNDVKLLENTTEILLAFLMKNPEAVAVAPLLYYPDGRVQISCRRFPTPSALFLELLGINKIGTFHRWKLREEDHLHASTVLQPMASVLMVKRYCWDTVGPLDEQFPVLFNDVDWCYRLYKHTNYKIYLYPEAQAIHHEGASVNRLGFRKNIEFFKGLTKFYLKHFISMPFRQKKSTLHE